MPHRGYINWLDIDKTGNGGASMVVLRDCERSYRYNTYF